MRIELLTEFTLKINALIDRGLSMLASQAKDACIRQSIFEDLYLRFHESANLDLDFLTMTLT